MELKLRQPRYYILIENTFSQRDWERFGCDYFTERGYKAVPVDFLDYFKAEKREALTNENFKSINGVRRISSADDAESLFSEFHRNDFILNGIDLRKETVYLFSLFRKYNVEYAVLFLGNIPSHHLRRKSGALNTLEYMSIKIDEAISAISRLKLLLNMFKYLFCIRASMPFPRWVISAGHCQLRFGKVLRKPFYTTVIKTHSFDIDTIKNSLATQTVGSEKKLEPYAVFIDEGMVGHPDQVYCDFPQGVVSAEKYANGIKNLSNRLLNNLGLKLVVAAHPKSSDKNINAMFGGFEVVTGKTPELIKNSTLVICSYSTAVSFAVAFQKPIIFITSDEMEKNKFYRYNIARFSSWLGCQKVNIDHLKNINDGEFFIPKINLKYYQDYYHAFLEDISAEAGPIWKVVLDNFEKRV